LKQRHPSTPSSGFASATVEHDFAWPAQEADPN